MSKEAVKEVKDDSINIRMIHLVTQAPFGVENTNLMRLSDQTFSFKISDDFTYIRVTRLAGGAKCIVPMANVASIVEKE